jgi:hypothetical protein
LSAAVILKSYIITSFGRHPELVSGSINQSAPPFGKMDAETSSA